MSDEPQQPDSTAPIGLAALEDELRAVFAPVRAPEEFRDRLQADLHRAHTRLYPRDQAQPELEAQEQTAGGSRLPGHTRTGVPVVVPASVSDADHGAGRLVLLPRHGDPATGSGGDSHGNLPLPLRAIVAHPRTTTAIGAALAIAAAMLLVSALNTGIHNAQGFPPQDTTTPRPPTATRTTVLTAVPTREPSTAVVVAPPATPVAKTRQPSATATIVFATMSPVPRRATPTAGAPHLPSAAPVPSPPPMLSSLPTRTAAIPTPPSTRTGLVPATSVTTPITLATATPTAFAAAPTATPASTATTVAIAAAATPTTVFIVPTAPPAAVTIPPSPTLPLPLATNPRPPSATATTAILTIPTSSPTDTPPPSPSATALAPTTTRPVSTATTRPMALPKLPIYVPNMPMGTPTAPARATGTAPAADTATARTRQAALSTVTPLSRATLTASATATPTAQPTATPSATAIATATATATATPSATATTRPTTTNTPFPTASPTASPTATATPRYIVENPNIARVSAPAPNPFNGVLDSPLDRSVANQQPVSYTFAASLTIAAAPYSLGLAQNSPVTPTLAVYPLTRTAVTTRDVTAVTEQLGVQDLLSEPAEDGNGNVVATIQFDGMPYTLTVSGGYGATWFSLQAAETRTDSLLTGRLVTQAPLWLRAHGLWRPDLHPAGVQGGDAIYGQTAGGLTVLRSASVRVGFDSRGVLRDLRWDYVVPGAPTFQPALQPNAALQQVPGDQQFFYQGPDPSIIRGQAVYSTLTLAYVGVQGFKNGDGSTEHAYLEPVYILGGMVPTVSGDQPLSLYLLALDYAGQVATPTPTPSS